VQYTPNDLDKFCTDQEIEGCVIKLHNKGGGGEDNHNDDNNRNNNNTGILTAYRASTGNFPYFLSRLEAILNKSYTKSIIIIMW
jgi:hypothetical protein